MITTPSACPLLTGRHLGVSFDLEQIGLVEEGGVIGPGGIDADEGDGVGAGRELERGGHEGGVAGAAGVKVPTTVPSTSTSTVSSLAM